MGLQGLCENGPIQNSQWDPVHACARKIKCSQMHFVNAIWWCINAVRWAKIHFKHFVHTKNGGNSFSVAVYYVNLVAMWMSEKPQSRSVKHYVFIFHPELMPYTITENHPLLLPGHCYRRHQRMGYRRHS